MSFPFLRTKELFTRQHHHQQRIIMWRLPAAELSTSRQSSSPASDRDDTTTDKSTTTTSSSTAPRLLELHVGPRCAAASSILRQWRLPGADRFSSFAQRRRQQPSFSTSSSDNNKTLYLHVGPAGECWTGHSIFAAKHLQPDYVRSIAIPVDTDPATLVSILEDDPLTAQQIYDQSSFPVDLAERMQAFQKEKNG